MVDVETPIEAQRRMERERLAKLDISEEEMRREFEADLGSKEKLRESDGTYAYPEVVIEWYGFKKAIKMMQERCK